RLTLSAEEKKPVPGSLFRLEPRVRRRLGIDRDPIDVTTEVGARLLKCFVWAGQDDRLDRLGRAIEALRLDPPELMQADMAEALPGVLAERADDAFTVVFATAALGYLTDEGRRRVRDALEEAGRDGKLVFVSSGDPRT